MYKCSWTLLILTACGSVGPVPQNPSPQTLTVSLMGNGSVTSMPSGINCGSMCASDYETSTSVTLTASPGSDATFIGWSGDCSGTATCALTMDSAKSVTATFAVHGSKRWVAQIGFPGQDSIEKLVVDPDGNVIVAGSIT